MKKTHLTRRQFTKAAAASAVYSLIPGSVMGANNRLNVAFIGIGGQGAGNAKTIAGFDGVNVTALCDVAMGTGWTAGIEKKFPKAKKFKDFRVMFDKMPKDIDACTVAVPDHAHFPISMLAMSLGKHIYVEKPLAHTFNEIELMMAAEKKYKVACQMGNQGHSGTNYFQFKAWKEAGIIKDVTHVDAYMNSPRRWHPWKNITGFPQDEKDKMPEGLDWDTWLGTAPENPYHSKLHPGNWRSWYEYGNGAFGDWGPHILDTIHRFLELGLPETIEAEMIDGPNEYIFPMGSTIRFDFPARPGMPAMDIRWRDGVKNLPPRPKELEEGRKIERNGKIMYSKDLVFKGTSHASPLRIIPESKMKDMMSSGKVPKITGRNSGHHENFLKAARGEEETRSKFAVSGPLSQVFCLGVIAQRLGGKLIFDRKTKQVTNNKRANELLVGPPPRKGWEQFYKL